MFGYASDETPDLLPATLYYSHRILERMAEDRHSGKAPFLEPDAKSQVTLEYANEKPVRATALVVSTRSEEHTSELKSLMRISYAVFCLKKKKNTKTRT